MSSRRLPLSNNPNAANSPYRAVAAAAAKQKRSYAHSQREEAYGQPPPTKKQALDSHHLSLKTPTPNFTAQQAEGRVFTKKPNGSQQTAFDRKLEAARVRPIQQAPAKVEKVTEENLETIRQWQKHYRKAFPTFVFYFENISEDVRIKYTKQVTALGAREEKFFSNSVTHVVTTRVVPAEQDASSVDTTADTSVAESHTQSSNLQTINPLLLDRSSESAATQFEAQPLKGRFTFEASTGRKTSSLAQDIEVRRQQGRNADVLHRARELGMKIWALEKLQRMMTAMFDTDTGLQLIHGHNTRSNVSQTQSHTTSRSTREADLSQLLRNERINGPSDRDPTVASKEMVIFKGPFIYVHDVNEKLRPIMVREYAKVSHKEDGDWPQFRSVANGKCPFVEEVDSGRRDAEKETARVQQQREEQKADAPRTRATTAEEARMQPPKPANKRPLAEAVHGGNRGAAYVVSRQSNPFDPPKMPLKRTETEPATKEPQNAFVSRARVGPLFGGEPVASGVQPSNITSAIRSQMISSTAAAPGAKAGTSKEVHGLQRKVLERNSGPTSLGLTSSHRMTDISAASKEDAGARHSKRNLAFIEEEFSTTEMEDNARRTEATRKAKAVQKRQAEKRDPKPGYCENCMDKFEDFDEHIMSRKHRKFAERNENWAELDALLEQLERPPRRNEY